MNYREIINQIIDATEEHVAAGDTDIKVCMDHGTIIELWSLANRDGGYWATMNHREPMIAYMLMGYPLVAVEGIPFGEFVISSVARWNREAYLKARVGAMSINDMRAAIEELERKR